ncbi:nucleotidyltransferase substrate binding protein, HI0074 family [Hydrogenobacter thermophilus TK-6]|uniref:Nucleotidyltransferase substrate binding protein n=1 Tax=Hydrogenobacter thermophilus (strain DSM 6534 / IAM 12695 / TK-6) TaxID=608538 RepID=D3DH04_HYDTT|nr:nucleotidyltransferase substrate binding protein [Hydrogenobacter thermophilus]ADO45041.1 nucleotidyltransferase substrate binding protein, HI0074 family [Hydrogenobacter thermophilus TK-6]BAI69106.1 nucleotidyltransferase substrate binding protein [Hydrogenobacter thermophilus TK-6]
MNEELRWQQRFENYKKAFIQFQTAVRQYKERGLNDLEKQGLIQTFEYTFELAWNLLRDYFIYQGIPEIRGSRDAIRLGLKYGIIENGEIWFQMISARNLTVHTYNEKIIEELL